MIQQRFNPGPHTSHRVTVHVTSLMKLLPLPYAALQQHLEHEVSTNPALEMADEPRCPNCNHIMSTDGICYNCIYKDKQGDSILFSAPQFESYHSSSQQFDDDEIPVEETAAYQSETSLPEYVYAQISTELKESDKAIAFHILATLNEDGLLTSSLEEIARYNHRTLQDVAAVQQIIMRADPVGVGACNPQQAMLVQLDMLQETEEEFSTIIPFARTAIQNHYETLFRQNFRELTRAIHETTPITPSPEIYQELMNFIAKNLNPYPGRAQWGSIHLGSGQSPEVYYTPDVVINRQGKSGLKAEILTPIWGSLQINSMFKNELPNAPEDKQEQWREDLNNAALLIKCVRNRYQTIVLMMKFIIKAQRNFFIHGGRELIPMTRAEVAKQIGVHESTISRAVSDKRIQLPSKRIIPLAELFDRSLPHRLVICEIIAQEVEPLSDIEIMNEMNRRGVFIKRRTVAKYRAQEGIPPARLRKRKSQTQPTRSPIAA